MKETIKMLEQMNNKLKGLQEDFQKSYMSVDQIITFNEDWKRQVEKDMEIELEAKRLVANDIN